MSRLILDEYRARRGAVDDALIKDAQRVFEAVLASLRIDEIEAAMEASRFHRTDEYGVTIRVLHQIATERHQNG